MGFRMRNREGETNRQTDRNEKQRGGESARASERVRE